MLGGGSLPALPAGAAAAKPASSASGASASEGEKSGALVPEVVNGVTKPLTGLTGKLTGGTLLQGKKSTGDGSSTGLSKKQESGLLGFLFGGGE